MATRLRAQRLPRTVKVEGARLRCAPPKRLTREYERAEDRVRSAGSRVRSAECGVRRVPLGTRFPPLSAELVRRSRFLRRWFLRSLGEAGRRSGTA